MSEPGLRIITKFVYGKSIHHVYVELMGDVYIYPTAESAKNVMEEMYRGIETPPHKIFKITIEEIENESNRPSA